MRIKRLPRNDKTNGWNVILPTRTPNAALAGDQRADWLVLGAGYAGLAAARRLAEHRSEDKIAIVEAGVMGENASARNSGFGIDIPHVTGSAQAQLDGAQRYLRISRAALGHLQDLVQRHGIDCDWTQTGKFQTAVTRRGKRDYLEPMAEMLKTLNEPYEWKTADELAARLGTAHFHAGLYTPGCILLNPAALTRGLADNLPENVTLYENSPVAEFSQKNGIKVTTASGVSLFAPKMILATNAFSEEFGFYKMRLIPFHAHDSLTRPLTDDEHETYGSLEQWGVTPANAFVSITMRYTKGRRFLIRQDINYRPSLYVGPQEQQRVQVRHQELFRNRFPQLPDVTMEHTWTGFVCLSYNHAPGFGRIASNVWAAVCQNAIGVTQGTMSGLLAADMACDVDNPLLADVESLGTPSLRPPRPFFDIGLTIHNRWHYWRERDEA
jgi:glycine/D-amino acid oxidase-like deaminating enzyme